MKADLYATLNVPKDATPEQIKRAYRVAVKKTHPDAGGNEDDFALATTAYDVLSDPERRRHYDETGLENLVDYRSEATRMLVQQFITELQASRTSLAPLDTALHRVARHFDAALKDTENRIKSNHLGMVFLDRQRVALVRMPGAPPILEDALQREADALQQDTARACVHREIVREARQLVDQYERGIEAPIHRTVDEMLMSQGRRDYFFTGGRR